MIKNRITELLRHSTLCILLSIFAMAGCLSCATGRSVRVGDTRYHEVMRPTIERRREGALEKKLMQLASSGIVSIAPLAGKITIESPGAKDQDLAAKAAKIVGQLVTYIQSIKVKHRLHSLSIVEQAHIDEVLRAAEFNVSDITVGNTGMLALQGITHLLIEDYDYSFNLVYADMETRKACLEVKYIRSIRLISAQTAEVLETYWDAESWLVLPDQSQFRIRWEQR